MINELTNTYFEKLEDQMIKNMSRVNSATGDPEELALVYGGGLPIYCGKYLSYLNKSFAITGTMFNLFMEDLTIMSFTNMEDKTSLLDLVVTLYDNIGKDSFYGMTANMGDTVLNLSHPTVLQNLFHNIDRNEELFDNVLIYTYNTVPSLNNRKLKSVSRQYATISDALKDTNKQQYKINTSFRELVTIKETYGGDINFECIVPIQTAYFGSICVPYYGLDMVRINDGDPYGATIWPITSPNIDQYNTYEVCTGSSIKTLEGVAVLFNANFLSAFPYPASNGTLGDGHHEAVAVMKQSCIDFFNEEFQKDFAEMDGPIPNIFEIKEEKRKRIDSEAVKYNVEDVDSIVRVGEYLIKEFSDQETVLAIEDIDELQSKLDKDYVLNTDEDVRALLRTNYNILNDIKRKTKDN